MKKWIASLLCLALLFAAGCSVPDSSSTPVSSDTPPSASNTVASSAVSSNPLSMVSDSTSSSLSDKSELPFDAPERWQEPLPRGMVGGWHAGESVGSGYAERYFFYEDGTYYYAASQFMGGDRLRYTDGEWSLTDETLHLTAKRKVVMEGGEYLEGEAASPQITAIVGGEYVRIELEENEYESINYPVQLVDVGDDPAPGVFGSIMLGDLQLYAKGGVDYDELLTLWDFYGTV